MEMVSYCMSRGDKYADPDHIFDLLDCAQICQLAADLMLRNSELSVGISAVCADACENCAESCEEFTNDARMVEAADMCRACAESCDRLEQLPVVVAAA